MTQQPPPTWPIRWRALGACPLAVRVAACGALAALAVLGADLIRPYAFGTTDDNWMYFLPLIKAHTDALLNGHFLRVLWSVGSGWSPWENAQVGVLYLPYHLANLLARALGRPLALLEVSAWMHLAAAGGVAHLLCPRELPPAERLGWALGAMLMPGPLLLGLNWHNYLTCYPWFLALAFLLHRRITAPEPTPDRRERLLLGALSLGFFLSSHAQMYVIGIGLLCLWALAEAPRRETFRTLLPLLLAQLPALIPLIYLKVLALDGTQDWMGDRGDPTYLLRHAQTLGTVLHGTVFGNLLYTKDFQLWANIRWTGVGMFFSPFLVLLARALWLRRQWPLGLFFLACLVFMGAASHPWLRVFGFGPLDGFRWTWKISIFTGPLALVSLAARWDSLRDATRRRLIWSTAGLSLLVFFRGLSFEIWPSLDAAHPFGAEGLVEETQRMARQTGLRPGTRIALLGPFDMVQPLPLPVLGLVGNAPVLSGLGAAHIYEPMEPSWASRGHLGLSLPWRVWVPAQALVDQPDNLFGALRQIGVQALVTVAPEAARCAGSRAFIDRIGRTLWVVPVPGAPAGQYPASYQADLKVQFSGDLVSPPSSQPPQILSPRPVYWHQAEDGTWLGNPNGVPEGWMWATVMATFFSLVGLTWNRWGTRDPGPSAAPRHHD